jgi:hypothetical protein
MYPQLSGEAVARVGAALATAVRQWR